MWLPLAAPFTSARVPPTRPLEKPRFVQPFFWAGSTAISAAFDMSHGSPMTSVAKSGPAGSTWFAAGDVIATCAWATTGDNRNTTAACASSTARVFEREQEVISEFPSSAGGFGPRCKSHALPGSENPGISLPAALRNGSAVPKIGGNDRHFLHRPRADVKGLGRGVRKLDQGRAERVMTIIR